MQILQNILTLYATRWFGQKLQTLRSSMSMHTDTSMTSYYWQISSAFYNRTDIRTEMERALTMTDWQTCLPIEFGCDGWATAGAAGIATAGCMAGAAGWLAGTRTAARLIGLGFGRFLLVRNLRPCWRHLCHPRDWKGGRGLLDIFQGLRKKKNFLLHFWIRHPLGFPTQVLVLWGGHECSNTLFIL